MRRHPIEHRVAAVKAFYYARGCLPLAFLLLLLLTGAAFIGNAFTFIPHWVNNFERRGSVLDKPPRAVWHFPGMVVHRQHPSLHGWIF